MLAYLIAVVQTIFWYYKAPTLQIEIDDETITIPSLLVSIMNGKRIGGGFWTAPKPARTMAYLTCASPMKSAVRVCSHLSRTSSRAPRATQPEIQMKRSKTVRVTATKGVMPVHIDGEILGDACRELTVEILPRQLEIVGV